MSTMMSYVTPMNSFEPGREEEGGPLRTQVGNNSSFNRFHPYQHPHQHTYSTEQTNSVSSTSPRSPQQCDKCGAICDDANQLAEHTRTTHPTSPGTNSYQPQQQAQSTQYQQLAAGSPQHHPQQQVTQSQQQQQSQAQTQQQQMHASPPQSQSNQLQHSQQPAYDFPGSNSMKNESKADPEEQAEILDLDSHKVQTHRFDEDYGMRIHHQHEMQHHMHIHQHPGMLHQSRSPVHSINAMLHRPPVSQSHDYHAGMSPLDGIASLQDQQNQFMLGQLPLAGVEPPHHAGSPIITSTQPIPGHPMSCGIMQPNPKPPPLGGNQSWKSNEARRPKTYNCTACNKWFTSSGHLKRHYNTTLHKNAVKQSNQPDPATMPISVHHHPGRDSSSSRGGGTSRNSPELSSSSSPPNLMAGPLGEAPRGLLQTPSTTSTTSNPAVFNNNTISSTSNSSEALLMQTVLEQKVLHQQQPHHQPSMALASNLIYRDSSPMSGLGHPMQQHHQHRQMGSPSPQLGQQQLHSHHLMDSPQQHMSSPMSPMQHLGHMSSPSMGSGHSHQLGSSSPTQGPQLTASSPPPTMGGTLMPHQPYPNALPPHVTTTTSTPVTLESITSPLTTTGNSSDLHELQQQEMQLPSFSTFGSSHDQEQKLQEFAYGYLVGQSIPEATNVGGLSPVESQLSPEEKSHESPVSSYESIYENYENYENFRRGSPPRYECLGGAKHISNMYAKQGATSMPTVQEANNNEPTPKAVQRRSRKERARAQTKEHQVTSTNGACFAAESGLPMCRECGKVFNKTCYLTQHNASFHSGEKPYKCSTCGKRFEDEGKRVVHMQRHAGDKPYKCEVCPKQFNHKTDLRRHLCLHTGEKPYACDKCGKGFIRKDHMMKHVETHNRKGSVGRVLRA